VWRTDWYSLFAPEGKGLRRGNQGEGYRSRPGCEKDNARACTEVHKEKNVGLRKEDKRGSKTRNLWSMGKGSAKGMLRGIQRRPITEHATAYWDKPYRKSSQRKFARIFHPTALKSIARGRGVYKRGNPRRKSDH